MENLKTITVLLIGKKNSGKSTLGNEILNSEYFLESHLDFKENIKKEHQKEEIIIDQVRYVIVEVNGLGNPELGDQDMINIFSNACYQVPNGFNQIFYTTSEIIDETEEKHFNCISNFIFGSTDLFQHITLVRTKFPDFENRKHCEADLELCLGKSNLCFWNFIKGSNKVIHVNTPSIYQDDFNENITGPLLRSHLLENCQDIFKPKELDDFNGLLIKNQTNKIDEIQNQLKELKEKLLCLTLEIKQEGEKHFQLKQENQKLQELNDELSSSIQNKLDLTLDLNLNQFLDIPPV
ncbi:hypothetical protein CYY_006845 [Polysphondylium violaceum]|uniref:AIG1-type G domain-containing protein n=1 Tax=Polysphondylium violaceum TaxID=133409 RepID=A0A8J4PQ01_9MYCE|nr:hypothetical protein CYY_006845 [Polysphondylium violaceum]